MLQHLLDGGTQGASTQVCDSFIDTVVPCARVLLAAFIQHLHKLGREPTCTQKLFHNMLPIKREQLESAISLDISIRYKIRKLFSSKISDKQKVLSLSSVPYKLAGTRVIRSDGLKSMQCTTCLILRYERNQPTKIASYFLTLHECYCKLTS